MNGLVSCEPLSLLTAPWPAALPPAHLVHECFSCPRSRGPPSSKDAWIKLAGLGTGRRQLLAGGHSAGSVARLAAPAERVSARVLTQLINAAPTPAEVLDIAGQRGNPSNEIHCATVFYRLAKMHPKEVSTCAQSGIFKDLLAFTEYQVSAMEPYTLANLAWSMARLQGKAAIDVSSMVKTITDSLGAANLPTMKRFNPQGLSHRTLAFATLGVKDEVLMEKLAGEAICKIEQFKPQGLSNLAWAFATLGVKKEALMQKLAGEAILKMEQFNPQGLSNLAWAFATLQVKYEALMKKLAGEAIRKAEQLNPQDLSNLAWAFATFRMKYEALMENLAGEAMRKTEQFNPQGLGNLAWAFATLGVKDEALMQKLADEAILKVEQFKPQGLSSLARAFARLGVKDEVLMEKLAGEAIRKIEQFKPQDLSNLA